MGKISYETYVTRANATSNNNNTKKVGYFKLANDGDFAIVRFDYSSEEEFDIVDIHVVKDNDGRYRNIACLRESFKESKDLCPLCAKGEKVNTRFFVKMISYTKDENGKIIATPVVWERPAKKSVTSLKTLLNDYGDLRECVFKITRHGAKYVQDKEGKTIPNKDVTYSINYQNPAIYKEELGYVKDFSAFEDFDVSKHSYAVRTFDELVEFIKTGTLPVHTRKEKDESTTVAKAEVPTSASVLPETPVRKTVQVDSNGVVTTPVTPVTSTVVPETPVAKPHVQEVVKESAPSVAEAPVAPVAREVPTTPTSSTFDPTNGRPRRTYYYQEGNN